MNELPVDLIIEIARFCIPRTQLALLSVCRRFRQALRRPTAFAERPDFGDTYLGRCVQRAPDQVVLVAANHREVSLSGGPARDAPLAVWQWILWHETVVSMSCVLLSSGSVLVALVGPRIIELFRVRPGSMSLNSLGVFKFPHRSGALAGGMFPEMRVSVGEEGLAVDLLFWHNLNARVVAMRCLPGAEHNVTYWHRAVPVGVIPEDDLPLGVSDVDATMSVAPEYFWRPLVSELDEHSILVWGLNASHVVLISRGRRRVVRLGELPVAVEGGVVVTKTRAMLVSMDEIVAVPLPQGMPLGVRRVLPQGLVIYVTQLGHVCMLDVKAALTVLLFRLPYFTGEPETMTVEYFEEADTLAVLCIRSFFVEGLLHGERLVLPLALRARMPYEGYIARLSSRISVFKSEEVARSMLLVVDGTRRLKWCFFPEPMSPYRMAKGRGLRVSPQFLVCRLERADIFVRLVFPGGVLAQPVEDDDIRDGVGARSLLERAARRLSEALKLLAASADRDMCEMPSPQLDEVWLPASHSIPISERYGFARISDRDPVYGFLYDSERKQVLALPWGRGLLNCAAYALFVTDDGLLGIAGNSLVVVSMDDVEKAFAEGRERLDKSCTKRVPLRGGHKGLHFSPPRTLFVLSQHVVTAYEIVSRWRINVAEHHLVDIRA